MASSVKAKWPVIQTGVMDMVRCPNEILTPTKVARVKPSYIWTKPQIGEVKFNVDGSAFGYAHKVFVILCQIGFFLVMWGKGLAIPLGSMEFMVLRVNNGGFCVNGVLVDVWFKFSRLVVYAIDQRWLKIWKEFGIAGIVMVLKMLVFVEQWVCYRSEFLEVEDEF
ncbi:hypothetical protein DITRI_Ditri14bG0108900 [Diplodiscus trichospermus]